MRAILLLLCLTTGCSGLSINHQSTRPQNDPNQEAWSNPALSIVNQQQVKFYVQNKLIEWSLVLANISYYYATDSVRDHILERFTTFDQTSSAQSKTTVPGKKKTAIRDITLLFDQLQTCYQQLNQAGERYDLKRSNRALFSVMHALKHKDYYSVEVQIAYLEKLLFRTINVPDVIPARDQQTLSEIDAFIMTYIHHATHHLSVRKSKQMHDILFARTHHSNTLRTKKMHKKKKKRRKRY